MKALALVAIALFMVGCEGSYRYQCQDPENAEKAECNRPMCEIDGFCFDTLNGLPSNQVEIEEVGVADCNCETTGE